jgi:hypothetical protein
MSQVLTRLLGLAAVLVRFVTIAALLAFVPNASAVVWVKVTPARSPSARGGFATAYDLVSQKIVLFGGFNATSYLNETWTFDGITWTQRSTPVALSPRSGAMLAYDFPTGQLVLFGGYDGVQFLGDTWLWDGRTSTWKLASPTSSPQPMSGAMLFTDPQTGRASLFGGTGVAHGIRFFSSDTWSWTGTNWRKLHPATSPNGRGSGVVCHDLARKNVVISGGIGELRTEDTWTWDGSNWTQQFPTTQMPYVFYSSAAYDPVLQQVIVFGGDESSGPENATWAWAGSDWVQLHPLQSPSARDSMGTVYDFSTHELIMFGGQGLSRFLNDTWKLVGRRD